LDVEAGGLRDGGAGHAQSVLEAEYKHVMGGEGRGKALEDGAVAFDAGNDE